MNELPSMRSQSQHSALRPIPLRVSSMLRSFDLLSKTKQAGAGSAAGGDCCVQRQPRP